MLPSLNSKPSPHVCFWHVFSCHVAAGTTAGDKLTASHPATVLSHTTQGVYIHQLRVIMRFSGNAVCACLLVLPAIVRGEEPEFALSDKDLEDGGGYWTSGGKYRGGIPKVNGENLR